MPFTTPSGIQCRVKKVALSPLSGAAVQMTLDRELEEHKIGPDGEERLPDWQRELLIEAVRTDAGYDVGCKSRGWDYEGRELTILGGGFYWILNTETAEAIQIGDNWIDFEQMTRSYENDKAAD